MEHILSAGVTRRAWIDSKCACDVFAASIADAEVTVATAKRLNGHFPPMQTMQVSGSCRPQQWTAGMT